MVHYVKELGHLVLVQVAVAIEHDPDRIDIRLAAHIGTESTVIGNLRTLDEPEILRLGTVIESRKHIRVTVTDPDKVCMIAGTWSINEYIRKTPVLDGTVQMNSLFDLPGYYLIEESSPTSAGNLTCFFKQIIP